MVSDMKNNKISMRRNSLYDYKAVIFDLDGTLYYQKPFRIKMFCFLIGYILTHPTSISDMFIIKKYREIREDWEKCSVDEIGSRLPSDYDLDEGQYEYVARVKKTSAQRVRKTVEFFMLEAPLKLLSQFKDEVLAGIIDDLKNDKKDIKIVIYSDYPVENKLKSLGIEADYLFTSGDEEIGCMKPDPKGLRVILDKLQISNSDAIMIGDRYEKDGEAAIANDMDYIIVSSDKKERKSQIYDLRILLRKSSI